MIVIHVSAEDRRSFSLQLEMALATSGRRVQAGVYEVTIRRLSAKELSERTEPARDQ